MSKITEKFQVLLISIFLRGINLHCLRLLQIWRIIPQVIACGRLYSKT